MEGFPEARRHVVPYSTAWPQRKVLSYSRNPNNLAMRYIFAPPEIANKYSTRPAALPS